MSIKPTELSDVTALQLAEQTGLKGVPSNATHIRYLAYGGLDTETYLYFRAPRGDVDAFSKQLTGYVAADEATRQARRTSMTSWVTEAGPSPPPAHDIQAPPLPTLRGPGGLERDWWLPYSAAVTRAEGAEDRIANVFVIDHPDHSEVWAYMFVD